MRVTCLLLKDPPNPTAAKQISTVLKQIDPNELDDVVENFVTLKSQFKSTYSNIQESVFGKSDNISGLVLMEGLIKEISKISTDKRKKSMEKVARVLIDNKLSLERFGVGVTRLVGETELSDKKLSEMIEKAKPFLDDDFKNNSNVLMTFYKAPRFIDFINTVFFDYNADEVLVYGFNKLIGRNTPDAFIEIIDDIAPYMKQINSQNGKYQRRMYFCDMVFRLPKHLRTKENLKEISDYIAQTSFSNLNEMDNIYYLAPSEDILKAIGVLKEGKPPVPIEQTRALQHISEEMDRILEHRELLQNFTKYFLKCLPMLGIDEDHPIAQKAINYLINSSTEVQDKAKNPYNIFYQLSNSKESLLEINPPVVEDLQFNIVGFRTISSQSTIKIEDLPEIDKQLFRKIIDRMKTIKDTEEVIEYFQKVHGNNVDVDPVENSINIDIIENLFFGPDAIIGKLLAKKITENNVTNKVYYLYCIINWFSTIKDPGTPFSRQEEMLIGLANCLRVCSTGQSDALAKYYREVLPQEFHTKSHTAHEAVIEKIVSFLDEVAQQLMLGLLSEEQVLESLGAKDQVSHQTLYLTNRLYKQLGIVHQISFDAHTEVLQQELVNAKTEKLLERVLDFGTPQYFILNGLKKVNKTLETIEGQKLIDSIWSYLEENFSDLDRAAVFKAREIKDWEYEELFEYIKRKFPEVEIDDESTDLETTFENILDRYPSVAKDDKVREFNQKTNFYELTEKGMEMLLIARGYLQRHEK